MHYRPVCGDCLAVELPELEPVLELVAVRLGVGRPDIGAAIRPEDQGLGCMVFEVGDELARSR